MKRVIDIVASTGALVAVSPVLCAAGVLIGVTGGGPIFFRQHRQGLHRRPFRILKFRTMRNGVITPVGRVLRELGIDELPQLVNVLRGEMSMVGPRPLTEADVQRLNWDDDSHDMRWNVRPGITGTGQLRLWGACDRRVTWAYDRAYARGDDPWIDLKVLAGSLSVGVVGKARTRAVWRAWRQPT